MRRGALLLLLALLPAPARGDLIHQWTFDADYDDAVSDAHGTPVGTVAITDDARVGDGALLVNGAGDHVQVLDRDSLRFAATGSYTVAAWIKPAPGTSGWRGVVTKGRDLPPWYGIWIDDGGLWLYGVSGSNDLTGPPMLPDRWTHVAAVQDGVSGARELYVDGVLAGTEIARNAFNFGNLVFGGAASVAEWFVGVIDEVRVYDEALGPDEVAALTGLFPVSALTCALNEIGGADLSWENHPLADPDVPIRIVVNGTEVATVPGDATNATVVADDLLGDALNDICVISSSDTPACCGLFVGAPSPIHHWTFDADYEDAAADAHGTAVGTVEITDDAKVGEGALLVNGAGDHVQVLDRDSLRFAATDSYTVAAWVKAAPGGLAGWKGIVTKGRDLPPWFGIWIDPEDLWMYGVSATNDLTGPRAVPDRWTHVAAVQNGISGTRELFVDAASAGTDLARDAYNFGNLVFGGAASVDEWFAGAIDDVRVYDVPLSAEDIAALTGLFPVSALICRSNEVGGADLSWNNHPLADPDVPIRIVVNGTEVAAVPGDATNASVDADDLLGDALNEICVISSSDTPVCCGLLVGAPAPIHHWTFDLDYEDAASDAHGTPVGLAAITDDAKIGGGALLVNGAGDHVQVLDRDSLRFTATDSYTVAAWVKPAPGGIPAWQGVVTKGRDLPPWYGIWISAEDLWTYGVPATAALTGPSVVPDQWTHVAAVQNGISATRELFVDAAFAGTDLARDAYNFGALIFGGAASVDEWFAGVIDDVRVYDAPLPERAIAEIYEGEEPQEISIRMGDANGDDKVDIADAIFTLTYLFAQGPAPVCAKAADPSNDGSINIADSITMLGFLFASGRMFAPDGGELTGSSPCATYAGLDTSVTITDLPYCETPCAP